MLILTAQGPHLGSDGSPDDRYPGPRGQNELMMGHIFHMIFFIHEPSLALDCRTISGSQCPQHSVTFRGLDATQLMCPLPTEGHLGCFQVLPITNEAALKICTQAFVWTCFQLLWDPVAPVWLSLSSHWKVSAGAATWVCS
ncbi:uncharacterized protein LOC100687594 [Canis lupus familiaris]|uniref:uncharacterized protein LOC100687594 n=1 Tax=Canis lupus familiaris TaxID=9615 RepID=UPI0018F72645|nr:uncharacterized protein LOC100687594 [Canis lupus familiaris]XP_038301395.1 uncharacterized protein LOC100687594 [Canis lupus familiaris]XP_038301396.1 uncharacterized protein LOC100687594 [Canis lupus familiaris]XP_038301397.1 uncharacterized protein LOC100687594 [Canis lupus familiaris]XP_038439228.1 uncharacterized protein LOC100687594 [Canis lupus familiaris]XP_038439229.1 uncharacterized protein LOC100687594 [Canis lupus familiaris]XP_038439230.1 uncharacterized protein LOC100687594 [